MSTVTTVDAFNGVRNIIETSSMRSRGIEQPKDAAVITPESYSNYNVSNSVPDSETYKDYHPRNPPLTSIPFAVIEAPNYTPQVEFNAYTARAFMVSPVEKVESATFNLIT